MIARMSPVATLLVCLFPACLAAQAAKGSVCVASRADDPWWKVAPPEALDTRGFRVRIDKRPAAPWPGSKGLPLDDLDLDQRHLIVALDRSGKAVESVWFRFSNYKTTNLCMNYDGYQGMQLREQTRHTPWCKCPQTE